VHRTDRTASELLLALHARIGASNDTLAGRRQTSTTAHETAA
jgi:hypothetical protein